MLDDDTWRAVSELAASQHGRVTTTQAALHSIGRRRLDRARRDGLVERELPGVLRFTAVPDTWQGRLSAATLSMQGVASHRAAARLHGLDGFTDAPLEVTVARGRMPCSTDLVLHRWTDPEPEFDHTVVDGIACTSLAATLAQLGAVVSWHRVEQALDDALRQGTSLAWIQGTVERLHRPGPSGTATLVRLLADERRSGRLPDSWFERLCQRILARAGLPDPELQHEITLPDGRQVRLDLAWPRLRLAVECHSRRYHFGPAREAADHARDLALAAAGWEVLYMTWHHKRHPDEFVPHLQAVLATRAHLLGLDPAA